jgi:hypothetical protein
MLNIRMAAAAAAVSVFCCIEHTHLQIVTGILCASVPGGHFLITSEELYC